MSAQGFDDRPGWGGGGNLRGWRVSEDRPGSIFDEMTFGCGVHLDHVSLMEPVSQRDIMLTMSEPGESFFVQGFLSGRTPLII